MSNSRANIALTTLVVAMLAPRLARYGLTSDDTLTLVAAAPAAFHLIASALERYAPVPTVRA